MPVNVPSKAFHLKIACSTSRIVWMLWITIVRFQNVKSLKP